MRFVTNVILFLLAVFAINAVSAENAENTVATENVFSSHYYIGTSIGGMVKPPKDAKGKISPGVLGGYQFNRYFAIEGQFNYIPIRLGYPNTEAAILAKGSFGIGKTNLRVFAKAGFAYYFGNEKNAKDFNFPVAAGIDLLLTSHLTLEVAYKRSVLSADQIFGSMLLSPLLGKNNEKDYEINRASFGLIYNW